MGTNLLYLEDTYVFEGTASIMSSGENENGKYIILDKTIFYPQGGGQPTDTGIIRNENTQFDVSMVRMDEHGIVYHYGEYKIGRLMIGEEVYLKINKERRITNAKNHSAGHLIDIAIKNIGLNGLIPTKGYHFQEGPYVEYTGTIDDTDNITNLLQSELNRLIQLSIRVIVKTNPQEVSAPPGKVPRYVSFEGYPGCGCGGTHIRNSNEIGTLTIRKIKPKGDTIRISYSLG